MGLDLREQRIRLTWRSIKSQSIRFVLLFTTVGLCIAVLWTYQNSSNEPNPKFIDGQYKHNRFLSRKLNLLDENELADWSTQINRLHNYRMNEERLQQNHPCVIDIIRKKYLHPPADRDVKYDLHTPKIIDQSSGQAELRRQHFGNQTNGFFIESGAFNGEDYSNTLYMERFQNWTGILIEPNWREFTQIIQVGRKAFSLPVCLSVDPYPSRVVFNAVTTIGAIAQPNITDPTNKKRKQGRLMTVQCFPLYSILLAVGQTKVDFFSLDVEGYEIPILKTIPWHKVDIKSMTIEWEHTGQDNLTNLLSQHGYHVFAKNEVEYHQDLLFAKDESFESQH